MFLKCSVRRKDGKEHRSWSIVESRRVHGGGVVQRHLLYLGEINDSQQAAWQKSISVFAEGEAEPQQVARELNAEADQGEYTSEGDEVIGPGAQRGRTRSGRPGVRGRVQPLNQVERTAGQEARPGQSGADQGRQEVRRPTGAALLGRSPLK